MPNLTHGDVLALIGAKEVELMVLRQRVAALEAQLKQVAQPPQEKADGKA